MSSGHETPSFRPPENIISPEVDNITKQRAFIQSGISYRCYQQVPLTDINEVYSNSRALNFYFNQKICYINPKKTFLALKVQCAKQDGSSILATDYVSCAPMKGQGMVDDVSVTIGTSYILYRSILINTGCNDRGGVPRVKHTILPSCISFGMDCT
jgi:hypothetical protein